MAHIEPPVADGKSTAPRFTVPPSTIVSIEHPCLVKNVGKAIEMLGGPGSIADSLQDGYDKSLSLSFRPHDPACRKVLSLNGKTDNVLLKITVPKRTGRKRKRGTDDPFLSATKDDARSTDAQCLIQSLADNPHTYTVEPLGTIHNTHVWRSMPDFVYSTRGSQFLDNVRGKLVQQDYTSLQKYAFPQTYGLTDTEAIAPPVLSDLSLSQNYTYRQNAAVKSVTDPRTGEKTLSNVPEGYKLHTYQCKEFDEAYPDVPAPTCPPLAEQPQQLQDLCPIVLDLFEKRPLWTRRALINQLPPKTPISIARQAFTYVAFTLRAGPWRDTYCKFGVDPRTDRKYRKYQTVLVQLVSSGKKKEFHNHESIAEPWATGKSTTSHIFTGTEKVSADGRVWQLCDLEDPQLKALVDIPESQLRSECERKYFGWYPTGKIAKIRVALKAKIDGLSRDEPLEDAALDNFLALPEQMDRKDADSTTTKTQERKGASKREQEWAGAYRSFCKTFESRGPRPSAAVVQEPGEDISSTDPALTGSATFGEDRRSRDVSSSRSQQSAGPEVEDSEKPLEENYHADGGDGDGEEAAAVEIDAEKDEDTELYDGQ